MSIMARKYSDALWSHYFSGKIPVIPDIKTRSPQAGDLLQGRDPVELAQELAEAGAPALSVVTEPQYFGGSFELLQGIAVATSLPILRKDFINKPEQMVETAGMGASAVLLIASMLEEKQLYSLIEKAFSLGLEPLVETHDETEILSVINLNLAMLGINNRNIIELEMDDGSVDTTEKLAGLIGPETLIISESSIASNDDVRRAIKAGAHAVLVGTAILQARDSAEMYRCLAENGVRSL